MALLGVDAGSSGIKAVIFKENGIVISSGLKNYQTLTIDFSRAEVDPEVFMDAFFQAVISASCQTKEKIEAMAISSHGESFAALSPQGESIGNIILNSDNRAKTQTDFLIRELGFEQLYKITGVPPHPMFGLMKIMYGLQKGIYDQTTRFLNAGDFILFRLGLVPYTDYSLAGRMFGFDLSEKKYASDILNAAGIRENQLPSPIQAGSLIGTLSDEACACLGISKGVKVVVGGHDQACGALGSGVITTGASISAGSYESIVCAEEKMHFEKTAQNFMLNYFCHVVPNTYGIMAFFPAGFAVRWVVDQMYDKEVLQSEGHSVYELLEAKLGAVIHPTGICFLPHLVGACNPHWDVRATGVIAGITLGVSKLEIYQAVFEGIACELSQNISALESIGTQIHSCNISGNGSRSDFSVQLRASLIQKPINRLTTSEAVCQGAAMLAGVGTKAFSDYEQAKTCMVHFKDSFSPDLDQREEYSHQMRQYENLFKNLEEYRGSIL